MDLRLLNGGSEHVADIESTTERGLHQNLENATMLMGLQLNQNREDAITSARIARI